MDKKESHLLTGLGEVKIPSDSPLI